MPAGRIPAMHVTNMKTIYLVEHGNKKAVGVIAGNAGAGLTAKQRAEAARAGMWLYRKTSDTVIYSAGEPGCIEIAEIIAGYCHTFFTVLKDSDVSVCESNSIVVAAGGEDEDIFIPAGIKAAPWKVPSKDEIEKLYSKYDVPPHIVRHMKKVAEVLSDILSDLRQRGTMYDDELMEAAALTHDIARTRKDHPEAGANILKEEGYDLIGMIVKEHNSPILFKRYPDKLSEEDLLFYADKIVKEDHIVTLKERFEKSFSGYTSEDAQKNIRSRYNKAANIERQLHR